LLILSPGGGLFPCLFPTTSPCPIHARFFWRMGGKPQRPIRGCPIHFTSFVKWMGNHITVFLPDHSPCSTAPPILNSPWKRLNADNPLPWNLPKAIAENYARFGYTRFVQSKKCMGSGCLSLGWIIADRWDRQDSPLTTFRMTILQITLLFARFCSDTHLVSH
jgi:hypothetical protein